MLLSKFFQKPVSVGLDIQADAIRLLHLRRTRKQIVVEAAVMAALPAGAVVDGKIQQSVLVSQCLRELAQRSQLKKISAVVALPAQDVIRKSIQLTKGLRASEKEAEIEFNLTYYLPGVTEALCYDYVKLGAQDAMQDNILLAAARLDQLNTHVSTIEQAGIQVRIVDVDIYALERAACCTMEIIYKNPADKLLLSFGRLPEENEWLLAFGLALRGIAP